jgi:hypothetical protein
MKKSVIILLLLPNLLSAQSAKQDSIWKPINFFVGSWKGTGDGEPGKGNYERTYQSILTKKFIEIRNKSTYPPTDKNPKGEVHEDIGYMSYDKGRKTFVLRQFHIEGFVIQYRLDSVSANGKTIVFISEAIENIAPGWKAKETYHALTEEEFTETFELAPPNGSFKVYTKTTFTRLKQ